MNDVILSTVNEVKGLGIFLDTQLSWDKHIRYTTANARKLTGLIKRTVGHSAPVSVLQQLHSSIVMPQLEYATPVWNSLSKSQIQTLERVQRSYTKFKFGYESPLTYPDRLDRLNMFLYHPDEIFQTCVSYTNLFKILAHYPQTVYILEMTSDLLHNLNHQIFQYHDVKMSNLGIFILTGLYIVGTSFPRVLKMPADFLVFKKSLTTYFNDILESNFNVNDTCTWVHVCKCALCRQC